MKKEILFDKFDWHSRDKHPQEPRLAGWANIIEVHYMNDEDSCNTYAEIVCDNGLRVIVDNSQLEALGKKLVEYSKYT